MDLDLNATSNDKVRQQPPPKRIENKPEPQANVVNNEQNSSIAAKKHANQDDASASVPMAIKTRPVPSVQLDRHPRATRIHFTTTRVVLGLRTDINKQKF